MKHTYFNRCEHCGAYLDPGERCGCGGDRRQEEKRFSVAEANIDELARKRLAEIRAEQQGIDTRDTNGLKRIDTEMQRIIQKARKGIPI